MAQSHKIKNKNFSKNTIWKACLLGILCCFVISCQSQPRIDKDWMDAPAINDASLINPAAYLVSQRYPSPDANMLDQPVVIVVHGFSASTFEWDEFKTFAPKSILVSSILLGGHGRDYTDFKKATWQDWGRPIWTEYKTLSQKGYKHISIAAVSAGSALVLEEIKNGTLTGIQPPEHLILIDSMVVLRSKLIKFTPILALFMNHHPAYQDKTSLEHQHWYCNHPANALKQLIKLYKILHQDLEAGIILPSSIQSVTIYQSKNDPIVDPISAMLMYQGLTLKDGRKPNLKIIDSNLHVATRVQGRAKITQKDKDTQKKIFKEILNIVTSKSN